VHKVPSRSPPLVCSQARLAWEKKIAAAATIHAPPAAWTVPAASSVSASRVQQGHFRARYLRGL
jgi:hypothetical protein